MLVHSDKHIYAIVSSSERAASINNSHEIDLHE